MKGKFCFVVVLTWVVAASCSKDSRVFTLIDADDSGIDFVNEITVHDTVNIFDNEFVYNGGGVAIEDLNGDGLQDVFFTGNLVENRMYLNKGGFEFTDVTEAAGLKKGNGAWSAGVTVLDINRDGKLDIYVSNTLSPAAEKKRNFLYINQGNGAGGIPLFKEQAAEYGLADNVRDSAAGFFDYDLDGDLDAFIAVNFIDTQYPNQFITRTSDGSSPNRDLLLRNDWDETLKHPVFHDVSQEAGIVYEGYSHSFIINDFDRNGWPDIYVCNDYWSNDLLYLNNGNGTFSNRIKDVFKHESMSAMGSDIADINNDGREDLFVTEMLPMENKRKKLFLNANNYTSYIFIEQFKYEYQYVRNTLQLNRGTNPDTGLPVFSDISFFANVQETDWSWTPLMTDFNNDGNRDILVTNGFPRDITDHDFGAFRKSNASTLVSKTDLYRMIPEVKIPNMMFRNNGDATFSDSSTDWGLGQVSFSNGAAYGDLDNDGDLDLIINNINDLAFVYRNNTNPGPDRKDGHFLRVALQGPPANPDAYGSEVKIFYNGHVQIAKMISSRGYLSHSENVAHFGLGTVDKVDSIRVLWPDNRSTLVAGPRIDGLLEIKYENPVEQKSRPAGQAPFSSVDPKSIGLAFLAEENDYIDFNFQRTLPHKFSQYGPGIAVGDVNGDGLDDVVLGGSSRFDETVFVQGRDGTFTSHTASLKPNYNKKEEDLGLLLFDADGDHDNDLYLARGSYQHPANSLYYQHLLCINKGGGRFEIDSLSIGKIKTCGGAVKAADYDGDGDLDLFIGGRVLPKSYPKTDRSFVLRNESKGKDKPQFVDVTRALLPELEDIGMISDALWSDFDNDGRLDLILAGEWMPLTFLKNQGAKFENVTSATGISDKVGWWNSLSGADVDNDGDTDYLAGNFGQNIYFKCSSGEPLTVYAKDFDNNGLYDPFISCYWKDSTGSRHEYFYHTRDDMIKQLVMVRSKFRNYAEFGKTRADQVFTKEELQGAEKRQANWLNSSYIENKGGGKFEISALPWEAQLAPLYGMLPYDYDADGWQDFLIVGNDYGMELLQGRADALYGLVLRNEQGKGFRALDLDESHFFVPHDARGLSRIWVSGKGELVLATQNRDSLRVISTPMRPGKEVRLERDEVKCEIEFKSGKKQKREFYWGSTFVSQEPRSLIVNDEMKQVTMYKIDNSVSRTLKP